jgi:hypothetical protein
MCTRRAFLAAGGVSLLFPSTVAGGKPLMDKALAISVAGDWKVTVPAGTFKVGSSSIHVRRTVTLAVAPPKLITVRDEKYDVIPEFNSKAAPWTKGARLRQLVTFETTAPDMLLPDSLVLKAAPGSGSPYVRGKDYDADLRWATIGRLRDGIPADHAVYADYQCGWNRIDSILVVPNGEAVYLKGEPHNATPQPPEVPKGHTRLVNIWVPGSLSKVTSENLYPIVEPEYAVAHRRGRTVAESLLPTAWKKLQAGSPLHVLAWGDSVTAGGQASDPTHQYQNRFVAMLRKVFPRSEIRLTTAAWGGRNSDSFLNEPAGTQYNFEHAVIEPKPDLIVMEFVNDAYMSPEVVEKKYSYLLDRFQNIGAEWVILTPHFVRPDWMGTSSLRVEADPRPYVAGVRAFAAKHNVALADASLRWGHLLKEGIPYTTLLSNSINHPDDRGHFMFALALMELFR